MLRPCNGILDSGISALVTTVLYPAEETRPNIFGLSYGLIFDSVKKDTGFKPHTNLSYECKIPIPHDGIQRDTGHGR